MIDKEWNVDTEKLTDREKEIWVSGYKRAIEEMNGLREAMINLATNYVHSSHNETKDNYNEELLL